MERKKLGLFPSSPTALCTGPTRGRSSSRLSSLRPSIHHLKDPWRTLTLKMKMTVSWPRFCPPKQIRHVTQFKSITVVRQVFLIVTRKPNFKQPLPGKSAHLTAWIFLHAFGSCFLYALLQEIRISVLLGWRKNACCSVVLLSIRFPCRTTVGNCVMYNPKLQF